MTSLIRIRIQNYEIFTKYAQETILEILIITDSIYYREQIFRGNQYSYLLFDSAGIFECRRRRSNFPFP